MGFDLFLQKEVLKMKLQIKILNGKDCVVDVSPNSTIPQLKEQVEKNMGVPASSQRLVFRGKPLVDEKTVSGSGLTDNTKIFLVVKKSEEAVSATPASKSPHLWTELGTLLRRHFREEDAKKVLDEFRKDFYGNMASLSLDDIERIALAFSEHTES